MTLADKLLSLPEQKKLRDIVNHIPENVALHREATFMMLAIDNDRRRGRMSNETLKYFVEDE